MMSATNTGTISLRRSDDAAHRQRITHGRCAVRDLRVVDRLAKVHEHEADLRADRFRHAFAASACVAARNSFCSGPISSSSAFASCQLFDLRFVRVLVGVADALRVARLFFGGDVRAKLADRALLLHHALVFFASSGLTTTSRFGCAAPPGASPFHVVKHAKPDLGRDHARVRLLVHRVFEQRLISAALSVAAGAVASSHVDFSLAGVDASNRSTSFAVASAESTRRTTTLMGAGSLSAQPTFGLAIADRGATPGAEPEESDEQARLDDEDDGRRVLHGHTYERREENSPRCCA